MIFFSPMNRRHFLSTTGLAAVGLGQGAVGWADAPVAKTQGRALPVKFKLGCQSAPTTEEHLKFLARYGVKHICGYPAVSDGRIYSTVDELSRMKELAAKHDIEIVCVGPPVLESSYIDTEKHPAILLAKSPERDRDIESMQMMIRNCAQVGLPSIKYNMSILGVVRTERTQGRGDASYSSWKLAEAHPKTPLTIAGRVDGDQFWERISYFLDRIVPVANENKVRMACHPHDPGMPPEGYQGVDRVLGTVAGLKRFVSIRESAYHGLNFCQGTVSEMLADPGKEIYDVIRYFGMRKKIFNVHFRNIRGHRNEFVETYPDEGDVDMVKALRVYQEVGYEYMLMPDHVPIAPNDPSGLQSFAFCYGYIQGLIQSLERSGERSGERTG
jgi:mannonate dehydratase